MTRPKMPPIDSQLERRIVRHLDGELPQAEQAEFLRAVMRDPHTRQLMDQYAADAQLAAQALAAAVAPRDPALLDAAHLPPRASRRGRRAWWSALGVAASLALAVTASWQVWRPGRQVDAPGGGRAMAGPGAAPALWPGDAADSAPVLAAPQRQERSLNRGVIGVFDESGEKLYLLEIDREQTQMQVVKADL